MNADESFNPNEYWRAGNCPWTFFAFPTYLSDEQGLPPDPAAVRLLDDLKDLGIRVGIWVSDMPEGTTYFACPNDDIGLLNNALAELEGSGRYEADFCKIHSERLFSAGENSTEPCVELERRIRRKYMVTRTASPG